MMKLTTPVVSHNLRLLQQELAALDGYRRMGYTAGDTLFLFVFDDDSTVTQDDVNDLVAAHNPDGMTESQRLTTVQEAGYLDFSNLPGWATWTLAEAEDYIETNVTDLASAKVVLKAMAKALVALRNETWPNLQGS